MERLKFPEAWIPKLQRYVKTQAYRGSKREAYAQRPWNAKDLEFFLPGVTELSESFTRERKSLKPDYFHDPKMRSAYLLYFLPINFGKMLGALRLIPSAFWQRKKIRILDLGAGPGTATLAALSLRQGLETECVLLESNSAVLQDARQLIGNFFPKTSVTLLSQSLLKSQIPGRFDLILAHHVLNELKSLSALDRAQHLAPLLEKHLNPEGYVAIVEPALKRPTRELMALRDHLLEMSPLQILGPCLHREKCPMLQATAQDWCHFYVNWEEPDYLRAFDERLDHNNAYLKIAFLLLQHTQRAIRHPAQHFRVVSNRMQTRGKTELVLCGPAGRYQLRRLDRDRSPQNAALDTIRRGAKLAIPELSFPDFTPQAQLAVRKGLKIALLDEAL